MEPSLELLADRVLALRKKTGMTQVQLAEKAHVNLNTVSRLELKQGSPSFSTVTLLAAALGVETYALIAPAPKVKTASPAPPPSPKPKK